jgi:hypothetical protein
VGRLAKILDQDLRGGSDQNVAFDDLTALLVSFGFQKRIKGSHHVFRVCSRCFCACGEADSGWLAQRSPCEAGQRSEP